MYTGISYSIPGLAVGPLGLCRGTGLLRPDRSKQTMMLYCAPRTPEFKVSTKQFSLCVTVAGRTPCEWAPVKLVASCRAIVLRALPICPSRARQLPIPKPL